MRPSWRAPRPGQLSQTAIPHATNCELTPVAPPFCALAALPEQRAGQEQLAVRPRRRRLVGDAGHPVAALALQPRRPQERFG